MSPNESHPPTDPSPIDPESIVRALLGTASDAEKALVAAAVATNPAARRTANGIADIRDALVAESAGEVERTPDSVFRNARALSARLPRAPSWLDRMTAVLLRPIQEGLDDIAGQLAPAPALRGAAHPPLHAFTLDGARLDVQATPRDGRVAILVQLEHDQAGDRPLDGECAVMDHATGQLLAAAAVDEAGLARCELTEPPAVVEVAMRCPLGVFLSGPVRLR